MSEELSVYNTTGFIAPAVDLKTALMRYQGMKEFISSVLKEGVDYGSANGSAKGKPSLLKPGAEKLANFFGLSIHLPKALQVREYDWVGEGHGGEPFFFHAYTAQAYRADRMVAECEGSANSWEKKYRYRTSERVCPDCGGPFIIKGKTEYGGGWLCYKSKGGCGAKFQDSAPAILDQEVGVIKNPDPADLVNTIQKIAQKRAIVGAVLLACNASEYFTQDLEDFIQGELVNEKHQDAPLPPEGKSWPIKLVESLAEKHKIKPANVLATLALTKVINRTDPDNRIRDWFGVYSDMRKEGKTPEVAASEADSFSSSEPVREPSKEEAAKEADALEMEFLKKKE